MELGCVFELKSGMEDEDSCESENSKAKITFDRDETQTRANLLRQHTQEIAEHKTFRARDNKVVAGSTTQGVANISRRRMLTTRSGAKIKVSDEKKPIDMDTVSLVLQFRT